jgi:hypothetical protein
MHDYFFKFLEMIRVQNCLNNLQINIRKRTWVNKYIHVYISNQMRNKFTT